MSWRLDASADILKRSADLPSADVWSACGWFRFTNKPTGGNFAVLIMLRDSGSNFHALAYDGTADVLEIYGFPTGGTAMAAMSVGTWYFIALTAASGSDSVDGHMAAVGATALTSELRSHLTFTPADLTFGNRAAEGQQFDGRIAGLKVWDAELTTTELWTERWSLTPVRRANLHLFAPGFRHTELDDMSGNSRTLTAGGTLATEEGPPVPWIVGPSRHSFGSASGITLEQEGFRWRNDDGSESAASWRKPQDENAKITRGENVRLRTLINATGDPASTQYQLEYRKVGDPTWKKVDVEPG